MVLSIGPLSTCLWDVLSTRSHSPLEAWREREPPTQPLTLKRVT